MLPLSCSPSNLAEWTPIDHELVRIGVLELLELRQHVHAVDAAEGPEVEQHELAAQVGERERLGGVDPLEVAIERRRGHAARKGMREQLQLPPSGCRRGGRRG